MPTSPSEKSPENPKVPPLFSVIIPTYRRAERLALALNGILLQKGIPLEMYEVIVVDNDVHESGREATRHPSLKILDLRYEKRFSNNLSEARNLGARVAKGQWLAFLDDDCCPRPDWLRRAADQVSRLGGPGCYFGGGYIENRDLAQANARPESLCNRDQYLVEGNCFFRKSEYLELGGMRSDLGPSAQRFGYHEGSELQMRFLKRWPESHRRVLVPALAVHHRPDLRWRALASFTSGYDSVKVFGKNKTHINLTGTLLKTFASTARLAFSINQKTRLKECYRLGEILGEASQTSREKYREIALYIRHRNNRLIQTSTRDTSVWDERNLKEKLLVKRQPLAVGKIGGAELLALEYNDHFIRPAWPSNASWRRPAHRLANNAGFFPVEKNAFQNWDRIFRAAISQADFLAPWQTDPFLSRYERALCQKLAPHAGRIESKFLGRAVLPWIADQRWLVISPFVKTMEMQKGRLAEIHPDINVTKETWSRLGATCLFVRCPFQAHLEPGAYASWEEGLARLTQESLRLDFDLALIGAGAWSLPLAAGIKKSGRKAIHLGGEAQLIFGIKGKRWAYANFYNNAWIHPLPEDCPINRNTVEDGCYW